MLTPSRSHGAGLEPVGRGGVLSFAAEPELCALPRDGGHSAVQPLQRDLLLQRRVPGQCVLREKLRECCCVERGSASESMLLWNGECMVGAAESYVGNGGGG
eukprot:2464646-Rhodomonas_salina.1